MVDSDLAAWIEWITGTEKSAQLNLSLTGAKPKKDGPKWAENPTCCWPYLLFGLFVVSRSCIWTSFATMVASMAAVISSFRPINALNGGSVPVALLSKMKSWWLWWEDSRAERLVRLRWQRCVLERRSRLSCWALEGWSFWWNRFSSRLPCKCSYK